MYILLLTIQARTNVPGLSERTLQRRIASSGILTGSGIQVSLWASLSQIIVCCNVQVVMLDAAAKAKPNALWWIKGDACDVIPGLCESMQLKWSGDVDLNDGNIERDYQQYKSRLQMVSTLGLGVRRARPVFKDDLSTVHQNLVKDKDFLVKGNLEFFKV